MNKQWDQHFRAMKQQYEQKVTWGSLCDSMTAECAMALGDGKVLELWARWKGLRGHCALACVHVCLCVCMSVCVHVYVCVRVHASVCLCVHMQGAIMTAVLVPPVHAFLPPASLALGPVPPVQVAGVDSLQGARGPSLSPAAPWARVGSEGSTGRGLCPAQAALGMWPPIQC